MPILQKGLVPEVAYIYRYITSKFVHRAQSVSPQSVSQSKKVMVVKVLHRFHSNFGYWFVLDPKLSHFQFRFIFEKKNAFPIFHAFLVFINMEAYESENIKTLLHTCPEFTSQCSSQKYSLGLLRIFQDFFPEISHTSL